MVRSAGASTKDTRTSAAAIATEQPMKGTVDEEVLRQLYAQMLRARTRLNEDRSGKEALIGTVVDLLPGDAVAPAHDSPAIRSVLELAPHLHTIPPHLGLAAGVALAYKLQRDSKVVIALAAAATLDTGSSHEALTYAAASKLPLILVLDCSEGASDALDTKAAAYGIPSITADGNDAVAVYRVSREAINHARSGRGPTLIQCVTIDSATDPIRRIEHYLEKHGWWTPEWRQELTARLDD